MIVFKDGPYDCNNNGIQKAKRVAKFSATVYLRTHKCTLLYRCIYIALYSETLQHSVTIPCEKNSLA